MRAVKVGLFLFAATVSEDEELNADLPGQLRCELCDLILRVDERCGHVYPLLRLHGLDEAASGVVAIIVTHLVRQHADELRFGFGKGKQSEVDEDVAGNGHRVDGWRFQDCHLVRESRAGRFVGQPLHQPFNISLNLLIL